MIHGFKWLGNFLDKKRSYQFKKPLDNKLRSTLVRLVLLLCTYHTNVRAAREKVTFNTKT